MHKMLFGVFQNTSDANAALDHLYKAGVGKNNVSVIVSDAVTKKQVIDETDTPGERIVEGAASGATTGAVVGALGGLLIGIGAITIPGVGGLLIAGPVASALGLTGAAATAASGAVGGAIAGGLIGSLVNLGLPQEQATLYEERIKSGDILLIVNADSEVERATSEDVFQKHNASEINYYTLAA